MGSTPTGSLIEGMSDAVTVLVGQALNCDDRTPTNTQLLSIPKMPAMLQVNVLVGSNDNQAFNASNLALATKHLNAGGTLLVCVHFPNPFSSVQNISSAWHSPINLGSVWGNYTFQGYMRVLTQWFAQLPTAGTVIFRPLHEAGGQWFWWGRSGTNENDCINLFRSIVNAVKAVRPNTLCGFSGTTANNSPILYAYPGIGVVDYVGASLYSDALTFDDSTAYSKLLSCQKPIILFEMGGASKVLDASTIQSMVKRYPAIVGFCSWTDMYSLYETTNLSALVGDPNLGWLVPAQATPTVAAVNVLGQFTSLSAAKAAYPNATFTVWPLPSAPNS